MRFIAFAALMGASHAGATGAKRAASVPNLLCLTSQASNSGLRAPAGLKQKPSCTQPGMHEMAAHRAQQAAAELLPALVGSLLLAAITLLHG